MSEALFSLQGAARLPAAFCLGGAFGLLYDLLCPPRRRSGRAAALWDVLFALLAGSGAFLFAMGARSGRLGTWELVAMLSGFLLWEGTVGRTLRSVLNQAWLVVDSIMGSCKKRLLASKFSTKKYFQKLIK